MKQYSVLSILLTIGLLSAACVKVDNSLGKGMVDKSLLYDTYTEEFALKGIQMKLADDLSGYSDTHLTIGAIRDDVFGLTTRSAAFPLVPALDTLDLGKDPQAISFDLYFEADTISCANDNQRGIFQSLYVYELTDSLSQNNRSAMRDIPHGTTRITKGIPVYNGDGALHFDFTQAFAQKYVDKIAAMGKVLCDRTEGQEEANTARFRKYIGDLPGIYIETDTPDGNGGRINLFNFSCLSVSNNYYYRNSNVAILKVNAEWEGARKDSSFLFVPGEMEFVDESSALSSNTKFYQYCFNRTSHSTSNQAPGATLLVEGGTGLKPVISAKELQDSTLKAISKKSGDASKAIIVEASIVLPFEMPEDYRDMKYYPTILSPTIRTTVKTDDGDQYVTFAGLTDASVSAEDQGDIDRSNLVYSPDISYHLQELLDRTDLDTATDADIWLLTIHTQKVANANGSLYDSSYYQNLLYASYYNSLYGGSYGYGGYGYGNGYGYGSSYSNYYNYMMLAQMMAASSQQTYSYTTELDKDRYYCAILNGPAAVRHPVFRVTYAIPQK
ncbi:MAG: hypothetical protein J5669_09040 [Bacteroidales bacterium]|nr:hypothetical protein [Bacteroidales bacterium]